MFNAALVSQDYTTLRGDYAGHQLMALCPNTQMLVAQINQSSFPDDGFAQLTYDNVSVGAYTAVEPGMTVLISPTTNPRDAYWVGRVRAAPTSSVLYINETGSNFNNDDYIIVLNDYRLHTRESRPNGSGGQYKDYNLTYAGLNPIITGLTINGQRALAGAGICDPDTGVLELSFVATAIAAQSGASISSYAYTIVSGMNVTGGSASSASVTIEFDPGWYWLVLTVIDNGARSTTLRIPIAAAPADLSSVVVPGFSGAQIDGDLEGGYTVSMSAFDGVDDVLDNTAVIIFEANDYGGNIGGNIKFYGRFRTESNDSQPDESFSRLLETRFTFEDTAAQLSRLKTQQISIEIDNSANAFDKVVNLTYWRAAAYLLQWHSTFFSLFTLNFSDTSNDSIHLNWGIGGGDFLAELNGIAEDWAANFETAHDGRCAMVQRATSMDGADPADDVDRNALTTVANLTAQDGISFTLNREHVKTTGLVEADGGVYSTNNGRVAEYLSKAPGIVRGEGSDDFTLPGQVLPVNSSKASGEAELNRRAGHALAEQNPADELTVVMPDGYDFLVPSRGQWFTWTLDEADLDLRGISYDTGTRWLCTAVSYAHNNETGSKEVTITFRKETRGEAGETQPPPTPAETNYILPSIPSQPAYPNFPPLPDLYFGPEPDPADIPPYYNPIVGIDTIPIDGNAQIWHSASRIWATQNALLSIAPNCNDITPVLPAGYTISDTAPKKMGQIRDFYALVTDDTNSYVFYTDNPFAAAPVWTQSAQIAGVYRQIRTTSTPGEVYIYNPNSDEALTTVELDVSYFNGGNGYNSGIAVTNGDVLTITAFGTVQYDIDGNPSLTTTPAGVGSPLGGSAIKSGEPVGKLLARIGTSGVWQTIGASGGFTAASSGDLYVIMNDNVGAFLDNVGIYTINVSVDSGGGSAQSRYSSDFGATFASAVALGSPLVYFGGIDVVRIGPGVLGGYDGNVGLATTPGGAYSAYSTVPAGASASAIFVPRYEFGSSSASNANSTPDYLLGSFQLTAGNAALWRVTNSGATLTDITPYDGSVYGLAVSPHCLAMPWFSGSIIAALGFYTSATKIAFSTNQGGSWTFRGPLDIGALMVTFRKGDRDMQQLFGAGERPFYSPNRGATIVYKTFPADYQVEPCLGVSVYG